jgi:NAD(P)-dependent dehydrogenase (short-subunit alcohol dehydrogenase family)
MSTKSTVLVTGANTGLGFEIVLALCGSEKSYEILLGGRSLEKAQAAVKRAQVEFPKSTSTLSAVQIDLEDDDSITRCFEEASSKFGNWMRW